MGCGASNSEQPVVVAAHTAVEDPAPFEAPLVQFEPLSDVTNCSSSDDDIRDDDGESNGRSETGTHARPALTVPQDVSASFVPPPSSLPTTPSLKPAPFKPATSATFLLASDIFTPKPPGGSCRGARTPTRSTTSHHQILPPPSPGLRHTEASLRLDGSGGVKTTPDCAPTPRPGSPQSVSTSSMLRGILPAPPLGHALSFGASCSFALPPPVVADREPASATGAESAGAAVLDSAPPSPRVGDVPEHDAENAQTDGVVCAADDKEDSAESSMPAHSLSPQSPSSPLLPQRGVDGDDDFVSDRPVPDGYRRIEYAPRPNAVTVHRNNGSVSHQGPRVASTANSGGFLVFCPSSAPAPPRPCPPVEPPKMKCPLRAASSWTDSRSLTKKDADRLSVSCEPRAHSTTREVGQSPAPLKSLPGSRTDPMVSQPQQGVRALECPPQPRPPPMPPTGNVPRDFSSAPPPVATSRSVPCVVFKEQVAVVAESSVNTFSVTSALGSDDSVPRPRPPVPDPASAGPSILRRSSCSPHQPREGGGDSTPPIRRPGPSSRRTMALSIDSEAALVRSPRRVCGVQRTTSAGQAMRESATASREAPRRKRPEPRCAGSQPSMWSDIHGEN